MKAINVGFMGEGWNPTKVPAPKAKPTKTKLLTEDVDQLSVEQEIWNLATKTWDLVEFIAEVEFTAAEAETRDYPGADADTQMHSLTPAENIDMNGIKIKKGEDDPDSMQRLLAFSDRIFDPKQFYLNVEAVYNFIEQSLEPEYTSDFDPREDSWKDDQADEF